MNQITKRRIGIVLGILVLAGSFYLASFLSEQKEPPARKAGVQRDKVVDTILVRNTGIPTTLEVQGDLVAYDKIDIFSEVTGTLQETSRPFKVGSYFQKGNVIIHIDNEEAQLSLLSQKSSLLNSIAQMMPDLKIDYPESFQQWQNYLDQFEVENPLEAFPKPVNDQEKLFLASKNLYTQYYTIKSAEERLDKYQIVAPFSGVVTAASINPGAVVRAGQKLGELMNTANYELEATVALSDLKYIGEGNAVTLYSDDIEGQWQGRIKRISDQVDPGTQTVRVFVGVSGNALREGMYLRGEVNGSSIDKAYRLPKDLLVNQNSVYLVRDSVLELKPVQVLKLTGSSAIIRGLEDGTPIATELPPGAFDGMKVLIKGQRGGETKSLSPTDSTATANKATAGAARQQ